MVERGNAKHGSELDDQMKHETQALRQGSRSGHVEEFRETEPLPDDTDSQEVREAVRENLPPEAPEPGNTGSVPDREA